MEKNPKPRKKICQKFQVIHIYIAEKKCLDQYFLLSTYCANII